MGLSILSHGGLSLFGTKYVISDITSAGSITLKPSGDTDDYFTFSTDNNVPTITATGGGNLRLGSDCLTDRWLGSFTNTFFGIGVAGVGALSHSAGSEGYLNTGIGNYVLQSLSTGLGNTGIGANALHDLTTSTQNTAVGASALYAQTVGGAAPGLNNAFGSGCLQACTVGYYNCGFGVDALFDCLGGYGNIAIGSSALAELTSGYNNVAIGTAAGLAITTESGNVFIGNDAGRLATGSNQLYIANSDTATPLIGGDFTTSIVNIGGGLTIDGDFFFDTDGTGFNTRGTDGDYNLFKARDTGVGYAEVARLQGAADPYFQMTLPFLIKPVATIALPATPVEGMLAYDGTDHKLKVRVAAAWETVSSA